MAQKGSDGGMSRPRGDYPDVVEGPTNAPLNWQVSNPHDSKGKPYLFVFVQFSKFYIEFP